MLIYFIYMCGTYLNDKTTVPVQNKPFEIACLSCAAKLTWRLRGEEKCCPHERGRKLEHRAALSQRDGSAVVVVVAHFFLLFLYNTYVY